MSRVSTVYDRILVELGLLFTSKTRIPYPYDLIRNDDNLLRDGYGLKVGSAAPETLEFCKNVITRNFLVVLTREVFNTGSDPVIYDDISKQLLEDIYKVQDRFYEPDQIATEGDVVKIDIVSASAVEQVVGDKVTFLSAEIELAFTIQEAI